MKNWNLKSEDWEYFLGCLNSDPDLAAQDYEAIRQKLIRYFTGRRCADPESLTDQTIDRAARLAPSLDGNFRDNPIRYCYGIARYIHKEYLRQSVKTDGGQLSGDELDPYQAASAWDLEVTERCLSDCLQRLDARKREMFVCYYSTETPSKSEFR
ncbi:MAG TPA: hypothetical protein VJ302_34615, partial [Blastocatellia bacterium]|nr:hypothetical protein [Blastocatellia bacterium]